MIIPIDIYYIISNYSRPLTIDCLTQNRKKFYGICQYEECYDCIRFCPHCWKNFNIVYDMLCQLSLIIPVGALEDLQNKIIKYFIVRKIIKSFNFRTISDYQNDYCIFLTKFHNYSEYISPIHMRQPLDYRKIFLLFYIMENFLI